MRRIKIRDSRKLIWRVLLVLAIMGLVISFGLMFFLEEHALSPDQLKEEGRYCKVTTEWMSEAFAVESWDDVDVYDYYIVDTGGRFMIMETYLDDAEMLAYIDSLYDEDGNYNPVTKTLSGSSAIVDNDLKALAMEELSYWMDMELTQSDFDEYFYPYYLNMVELGDYGNIIAVFLTAVILLLICIIGGIVAAVKHGIRMSALRKMPYYERLVDSWSRTGEKMDTGRRKIVVLTDYLIIPEYPQMVLPLEEAAWFYTVSQGKNKAALYVMCFDGSLRRLCTIKDGSGAHAGDYLQQIRMAAPWCRFGYTPENRQAFGGLDRHFMLDKISAEKSKYLSQKPLY